MAMVTAKRFIVVKHFEGEPKRSDLKLVEEELPPIEDGEFLVQAEYLSVDAYMRVCVNSFPIGITMMGSQVARIVQSKNSEFPAGKRVMGYMGWRSHTIVNLNRIDELLPVQQKPYVLPDFQDLPPSLALGILGWPGITAYYGLVEICKPMKGQTLVVSGAAGAVGSHVGQVGKSLGLTVIGITGTDEKCNWLKDELSFDHTINYKTEDLVAALKIAAPNGVDCYFDNVGGDISSTVIYQMKPNGIISVCGSVSSYNADVNQLPKTPLLQPALIFKELKMEGFLALRWSDRWSEAMDRTVEMIRDGRLKYRETVTKGFDQMFDAFAGMLRGENIGKAIVEV